MNKKDLTEADIRTKFITPALVGPGGKWDKGASFPKIPEGPLPGSKLLLLRFVEALLQCAGERTSPPYGPVI